MITVNATYVLQTGEKKSFASTSVLICHARLDPRTYDSTVDVRVLSGSTGYQIDGIEMTFDKATLVALTPSGADEVLQYQNLIDQAVAAVLDAISENSAVTFTVV